MDLLWEHRSMHRASSTRLHGGHKEAVSYLQTGLFTRTYVWPFATVCVDLHVRMCKPTRTYVFYHPTIQRLFSRLQPKKTLFFKKSL